MSSQIYLVGDKEQLVVAGLSARLLPAQSVNLVFEFSNGAAPLELQAPVTVPLSPAPVRSFCVTSAIAALVLR